MIRTRLTDRFAIAHPVLCAPMALVTGGALAAAVSRAGGLGIVGGGYAGTLGGEPDLQAELAKAAGTRVGVGFITWALAKAPLQLELALAAGPACVFLSFGDPRPHAAAIHAAGIPLICQIQNLEHLGRALEAGAAAVVAQGSEAGGHGAHRATLPFVPEVADQLARLSPATLLLAAGGIADGRGLAAALMLGADGVVVGTRLWAATEALTPDAAVARAIAGTGDDTVRTTAIDALRGVPWPEEFSFRVIKNRLTAEWAHREREAAAVRGSLKQAYDEARMHGDFDVAAAVAGEAIGIIDERLPAALIIETMIADATARLRAGAGLV